MKAVALGNSESTGFGSGGQEGAVPLPRIFIHGANIVDRGLIVLLEKA